MVQNRWTLSQFLELSSRSEHKASSRDNWYLKMRKWLHLPSRPCDMRPSTHNCDRASWRQYKSRIETRILFLINWQQTRVKGLVTGIEQNFTVCSWLEIVKNDFIFLWEMRNFILIIFDNIYFFYCSCIFFVVKKRKSKSRIKYLLDLIFYIWVVNNIIKLLVVVNQILS